ncbi:MAG: glycerophosphodiester phosphodiesterase family protein [Gammaproteobacteria bacterium]
MTQSIPSLVAHRGYARRYPENTLLALQAAVDAGATYLEFDVLLTQDRVPVLFHDRNLQRMCGQQGAVHDYTLAQLKQFSVSEFDRFGYRFVGNPISTLQETVAYLAGQPAVQAFVELKRQSIEQFGVEAVIDAVLPLLEPVRHQVIIISYSLEALRAVREHSSYHLGAVFDHWHERKQTLIQILLPELFFTDFEQLPRFGKLKHPQCKLAVYDCVDPEQALRVHRRGVDLVETFAIAEMRESLDLYPEWR